MLTVDFAEIEAMQRANKWQEAGEILVDAGKQLEAGGADMLMLCTNTMHKCSLQIENAVDLPFLHIADATALAIKANGSKKIGLLGTMYTMEQKFYKGRLVEKHGLEVIVPESKDRELVHSAIFDELVQGELKDSSRRAYEEVIGRLLEQGAESVILGCTEIGMLVESPQIKISDEDSTTIVPIYDTTVLHAEEAVRMALSL